MSNARNLADIVTGNFDVPLGALDNVPPSNDASALTTGTLPVGRLPSSGVDASALTTGTLGTSRLPAGSVVKVSTWSFTSRVSLSHSSWYTYFSGTVNKQLANSTLIAFVQCNGRQDGAGAAGTRFVAGGIDAFGGAKYTTTIHTDLHLQMFNIEGLTSTGAVGWQYDQTHPTFMVLNPTAAIDDGRIVSSTSRVIIYEVVV